MRTFIEIADDLNDLVTELNDKIVESIKEKTADVAPVRHGRWESHTDRYICPICHKEWCFFENDVDMFSYCPHCGAKMDEGE